MFVSTAGLHFLLPFSWQFAQSPLEKNGGRKPFILRLIACVYRVSQEQPAKQRCIWAGTRNTNLLHLTKVLGCLSSNVNKGLDFSCNNSRNLGKLFSFFLGGEGCDRARVSDLCAVNVLGIVGIIQWS